MDEFRLRTESLGVDLYYVQKNIILYIYIYISGWSKLTKIL